MTRRKSPRPLVITISPCVREKARIPAWCDRILRKGDNLRQIDYNTAILRFSDHRPVYATFECTINVINELLKDSLSRSIYNARQEEVGGVTANAGTDIDDEDLLGYDSIAPGLPPASSDRRKWWLNNGTLLFQTHDLKGNFFRNGHSVGYPEIDLDLLTCLGYPARSQLGDSNNRNPNPQRPANPFTPSIEPDWIVLPDFRGQIVESRDDKHPKVPVPTTKLSTQYNLDYRKSPTGRTKRDSGMEQDIYSLAKKPSTSSSVSRGPAPPVPKKPPLLTSFQSLQDTPGTKDVLGSAENQSAASTNVRRYNKSETGARSVPPALPVREAVARSTGNPVARGGYLNVLRKAPPARELTDEEGDRAQSIPSLQPLSRH